MFYTSPRLKYTMDDRVYVVTVEKIKKCWPDEEACSNPVLRLVLYYKGCTMVDKRLQHVPLPAPTPKRARSSGAFHVRENTSAHYT